MLALGSIASVKLLSRDQQSFAPKQWQSSLPMKLHMSLPTFLLGHNTAQALLKDEDLKRLKSMNTNVYVWGEGYQVDPTQDYSNFTPKKIQNFKGKDKPNVVDMAFGWYHEAYID